MLFCVGRFRLKWDGRRRADATQSTVSGSRPTCAIVPCVRARFRRIRLDVSRQEWLLAMMMLFEAVMSNVVMDGRHSAGVPEL